MRSVVVLVVQQRQFSKLDFFSVPFDELKPYFSFSHTFSPNKNRNTRFFSVGNFSNLKAPPTKSRTRTFDQICRICFSRFGRYQSKNTHSIKKEDSSNPKSGSTVVGANHSKAAVRGKATQLVVAPATAVRGMFKYPKQKERRKITTHIHTHRKQARMQKKRKEKQ